MRIGFDQRVEDCLSFFKIACVVVKKCPSCVEKSRCGEDAQEVAELGVDGFGSLVEFLVGIKEEEVCHYVVREVRKN